jgi:nitrogen regulatory protein PII-like uncharacterized protein
MKLIKLTSTAKNDKYPAIYINVEQIGSIYQLYKEEYGVGKLETRVGVTTHNNGGFSVRETPEQIIKLINKTI